MRSIDIDFDVFKDLTARLQSEADTYNAVLRRLLELPPPSPTAQTVAAKPSGKPWVSKAVTFEHGTVFRANYKGQMYSAQVENGRLMISDKGASSKSITRRSVDHEYLC